MVKVQHDLYIAISTVSANLFSNKLEQMKVVVSSFLIASYDLIVELMYVYAFLYECGFQYWGRCQTLNMLKIPVKAEPVYWVCTKFTVTSSNH